MSGDAEQRNEVQVGHWYLCAICPVCENAIPILEIEPGAQLEDDGTFAFRNVPCDRCGAKRDYPLKSLQRLQAQPEGPNH